MEEVVQAEIECGGLVGARGRFRLVRPIESIEVPPTVQSLLAARIDRLDETSKRVLQTAAVIGDEVPEAVLERVEHDSLILAGGAVEQRAALLAHHWEQAGRNLEAARWQARIGTRLGFNTGVAAFHWRKVTELLAAEPETPEVRELLGQGLARLAYASARTTGSAAETEALFAQALQGLGDADSRARAWALTSYALVRNGGGQVAEAHRLAGEALAMARRLDDPALLAAILSANLALRPAAEFPDDVEPVAAEIDRLCATDPSLGTELGGVRPWLMARWSRVQACIRLGRGSDIDAIVTEVVRGSSADESPLDHVLLHYLLTGVRAQRGDASGALEHGRQTHEWAARAGNLAMEALGLGSRGLGLLRHGRLDEALEDLEQAIILALDRGMLKAYAVGQVLPLLAETQLRLGKPAAARAAAERGIDTSRTMGFRHSEAANGLWMARALIAAGDAAAAEAALTRAAELVAAIDARDLRGYAAEVRAELAARSGDAAAAERARREAARLHRDNGEEWLATQAEAATRA